MNWNLKKIYASKEEWVKEVETLKSDALKIADLKDKLGEKQHFLTYLKLDNELSMKLDRCYLYASLNYDLNQKNVESQEMYSKIFSIYNDIIAITSFVTPELISVGKEKLAAFLHEEGITSYDYFLDKLFRNQKHILEGRIEGVLANYNQALSGYNQLYDKLAVADNFSTDVKISTGEVLTINESNFRLYLGQLENQEDRRLVFETVFNFYDKHKQTFAGIYEGIMQAELAEVKTRGYQSILESHLYGNNIDPKVYLSLIKTTRNNTKSIKRYYELRRKFFGLEKIHTYDRFLDLAKSDVTYNYEEAKELFFKATATLGGEFEAKSHLVLEEGRVDVLPQEGKRTGAYSTHDFNKGTFILLNHNNNLDSAFTLAHEAGHSMHSLFAIENQPYETSNYVIFVAEIASTFNESLLLDYLMTRDLDKNTKITLLQQSIDNILSTFYRQSLFADYEYQAHKLVEDGKAVTWEALSKIMIDLYKDYYDIDIKEENVKEFVWAYIPHFFHTPFYVYQYATSFAASSLIYDNVKNKVPGAFEAYLDLLKSGGSNYPVELVKKAGVDLTTDKPFMAVCNRLDKLVDELEKLLEE